ncbi:ABATE domain-containing protein [Nocardia sp. NPDC048505]|uniref:CGNR zinc finger domain-containing protein n=1 Tax=unclassified Nocardia TaxID=2637762 RepID=UPI003408A2AC
MSVSTANNAAALPRSPGAQAYLALDFADSAYVVPGAKVIDELGTAESATHWLRERGLAPLDVTVGEQCVAQLWVLREHIRSLFAAHVDRQPPLSSALSAVNEAMRRAATAPVLRWDETDGPYRAAVCPPEEILDRALARLAADAADLLTGEDAQLLTMCGSVPCNRYLIRRGRRHWCSTRCGDRVRAARAYARTKAETA